MASSFPPSSPSSPPSPPSSPPPLPSLFSGLPTPPPIPAPSSSSLPTPPSLFSNSPWAWKNIGTVPGVTPTPTPKKTKFSRLRLGGDAHVRDSRITGLLVWFVIFRVMVLWILLFLADKVFQSMYVQRRLSDVQVRPPPHLWSLMPLVLACEALVMAVLFTILILWKLRNKEHPTFFIDRYSLSLLLSSYGVSTLILVLFGASLGRIIECQSDFRYHENGLRGIRALCVSLLPTSLIVIGIVTLLAFFS